MSALDPGPWHQAAQAWARMAANLDGVHAVLAAAGHALPPAWAGGLGAMPARDRVSTLATAVREAGEPARRIATALTEHAYGLEALRRLADQDLSLTERASLLARVRALHEQTTAVLLGGAPPQPAMPGPPSPQQAGRLSAAGVPVRQLRPDQVRAWWGSLTAVQRERLLLEQPDLVGWLDGVPAADRDRANRAVLARRIDELAARQEQLSQRGLPLWLTPPALLPWVVTEQIELAQVRARLAGLQAVRSSLAGYGDHALLLGVDDASGRVIVALGDPDHAGHTAVFVPGAGTDLRDTPGAVARAARLWHEADAMTARLGDVSVVYWLGYDAPDLFDVLTDGAARDGAQRLAPFLDGLGAAHEEAPAHVTLIGHSYGSTVIAETALSGALRGGDGVGDLVAAGSPGMHADRATDLGFDPRHVWGGLAPGDRIGGDLGALPFVHGEEPTDPAFGANRFVVDTSGHEAYWDSGSVSLRNQAAIVVGRYGLVSLVHGQAPPGAAGPFG